MITLSQKFITALLRSRGMLKVSELSQKTGVNRFTLTDILTGKRTVVQKQTYEKLSNWLATLV